MLKTKSIISIKMYYTIPVIWRSDQSVCSQNYRKKICHRYVGQFMSIMSLLDFDACTIYQLLSFQFLGILFTYSILYDFAFSLVVQLISHVQLFATPWTAALQAFLAFTVSWSLFKLMSIKSVSLWLIFIRPYQSASAPEDLNAFWLSFLRAFICPSLWNSLILGCCLSHAFTSFMSYCSSFCNRITGWCL